MANINRVTITGNLTRDPELQALPSGTEVCRLGVAVNHRRKDQSTDQWVEEPNFFDVTVFGAQGKNCATYLRKGRPVAIDGRLSWRSWQDKEGNRRSKVEIIAQTVQFLGSREDSGQGGGGQGGGQGQGQGFTPASDVPADTSDFGDPGGMGSSGSADDDIPF